MKKTKKNKTALSGRKSFGFLFISVWLFGFVVFRLYPFVSSFIYSFSDFHLFNGISKWGIQNYLEIFSDEKIMKSIGVTALFVLITVPLKLIFALFIACILSYRVKGVKFFRTAYYIPSILGSSVAIAVLWRTLFRNDGIINSFLALLGIQGPNWLADSKCALLVISFLKIWQFGSAMILFCAALREIPPDLYEAATIDGAGKVNKFFRITLPLITPVIFYNLITQLILTFQEFNGPYIITQGGPRGSTTLFSMLIYKRAFQMNEMGMANAMAWVLFALISLLSIIMFASQKHWVFYNDEK